MGLWKYSSIFIKEGYGEHCADWDGNSRVHIFQPRDASQGKHGWSSAVESGEVDIKKYHLKTIPKCLSFQKIIESLIRHCKTYTDCATFTATPL